MQAVRLVRTAGLSVLRQLRLEEALLRADTSNWCLVHDGAERATAVLGLSGKADAMLHAPLVEQAGLAVVRRFTGGGTVVVDRDTLFVSFIFSAQAAPGVACFPAPLMAWSESFYRGVFHDLPDFRLHYVLGERKFGGNAQSISKQRWVHHTSFLWDYQPSLMACLQLPERRPDYRRSREHSEFVCRLGERWTERDMLAQRVAAQLASLGYAVEETSLEAAEAVLSTPHLSSSVLLS